MKIKCPACSKVLSIPETAAGKVVKCPCGKQLRAPAAPGGQSPPQPSGGAASGLKPTQPTAGASSVGGGIDPDIFDDLTDNDLQPVKSSTNPYQSPTGGGVYAGGSGGPNGPQELASVGARIGGALLDGIAYILLMIPGLVIGIGMIIGSAVVAAESGESPETVSAAAGGGMILGTLIIAGNLFVPMIINCVLIAKSGQSIGKKIVGTRMVDQDSGETSGFVQGFLIRTFVFQLICNALPIIGFIIALVDIVFLFTEGNQTLHDRLARTRVVKA